METVVVWQDGSDDSHCIMLDRKLGLDGVQTYWSAGPFPRKKYLLKAEDVPWTRWPSFVLARVQLPLAVGEWLEVQLRRDEEHFNEQALLCKGPTPDDSGLECFYRDEVIAARCLGQSLCGELGLGWGQSLPEEVTGWEGPDWALITPEMAPGTRSSQNT